MEGGGRTSADPDWVPRAIHPSTLRTGDRFGRYTIQRLIGAGGMGVVYWATDEDLGRPVALKLLLGAQAKAARRFVAEARGQAQVEHPAVCRIYEAGEHEGQRFIAMRFVDGKTIAAARERMSAEQKVRVMREVAEGLHAAHRRGLIHRDVKPANILVAETDDGDWRPFVTDFGLVKDLQSAGEGLTESGMPMGSPSYMAPEQARGELDALDARTDVYALGSTLYDLLSGEPPFAGQTAVEIILKVVQRDPPPLRTRMPQISPDLEAVVMRCLEKEPRRRYPTARELGDDLGRFLDGEPVRARPTGWSYRLGRLVRRHKLLVATIAVSLVAVTVLAGLGLRARQRAARQAELAQELGQQVKDIEWSMRAAHLAPAHDITAEKQAIREQMEQLQQRRDLAGDGVSGPVAYALGRGSLALGDVDAAAAYLQQAWDEGYRDARVAYGLGLALGTLYEREQGSLAAIANDSIREDRRRQIEQQYRDPALQYLRSASDGTAPDLRYVQALIAYYDGDRERALQLAADAAEGLPWLYEARVLVGRIHAAEAADAAGQGRFDDARRDLERAGAAYAGAAEVGRSDPRVHLALCELATQEMYLDRDRGQPMEDAFAAANGACERALLVDPAGPDVWIRMAQFEQSMAFHQMYRGVDPGPLAEEARRHAEQALALAPDRAEAHVALGTTTRLLALHESRQGEDPTEGYQAAIRSYERALELDPTSANAHNALAGCYYYLIRHQQTHGQDSTAAMDAGITAMQRAVQHGPEVSRLHSNLGAMYTLRARAPTQDDPARREWLLLAIESVERSIEINPQNAGSYTRLGTIRQDLARLDRTAGADPLPQLALAIEAFEHALALKPEDYHGLNNLGVAHVHRAQLDLDSGRDPSTALDAAEASYLRAQEVNPRHPWVCSNLADAWTLRAEYDLIRGADPRPALAQAEDSLARCHEINPRYALAAANQANAALVAARHARQLGGDPGPALDRAQEAIELALEIDGDHPGFQRVVVRIELLRAHHASDRGRDPAAHLERAVEVAREALAAGDEPDARRALAEALYWTAHHRQETSTADAAATAAEGRTVLEPVLARNERDAEALVLDGALALLTGEEGARATLARGLELNPHLRVRWGALE